MGREHHEVSVMASGRNRGKNGKLAHPSATSGECSMAVARIALPALVARLLHSTLGFAQVVLDPLSFEAIEKQFMGQTPAANSA